MKKQTFLISFFFLFLISSSLVTAHYWDFVTIGQGDNRWCKLSGTCTIDNLIVKNLTIDNGTVNFINTTVININVTGDFITSGNVTAIKFFGIYDWIIKLGLSRFYLDFNGTDLEFNETTLNATIKDLTRTITYNATNIETRAGTPEGDVESIKGIKDGNVYNVTEATGSNPLVIVINFTGVVSFSEIVMREKYSAGSGHHIKIGIETCATGEYEEEFQPDITGMDDFAIRVETVVDPFNHLCGDNVSIRLSHDENGNPSHIFSLDFLVIQSGPTTMVSEEVDPLSLHTSGDVKPTGNFNWNDKDLINVKNLTFKTMNGSVGCGNITGANSDLCTITSSGTFDPSSIDYVNQTMLDNGTIIRTANISTLMINSSNITCTFVDNKWSCFYNGSIGGGGGFENPATEDLNMSTFTIFVNNISSIFENKSNIFFKDDGSVNVLLDAKISITTSNSTLLQSNETDNLLDTYIFTDLTIGLGHLEKITLQDKATDTYQGFIKFNKSIISEDILSAKLKLYLYDNSLDDSGEGFNVSIHHLFSNYTWNESIIWVSRPTAGGGYNTTSTDDLKFFGGAGEPSGWIEWDVTDIVRGESSDNVSFFLFSHDGFGSPGTTDTINFRSRNYIADPTLKPILNITVSTGTIDVSVKTEYTILNSSLSVVFKVTSEGDVWTKGNITSDSSIISDDDIITNSSFIGDGSQLTGINLNINGTPIALSKLIINGSSSGNIEISNDVFSGELDIKSRIIEQWSDFNQDIQYRFSTSNGNEIAVFQAELTNDYFFLGLSSSIDRAFIIGNFLKAGDNFDHGSQNNPTLFIQSDTDPDSDNTQWGSQAHNKSDYEFKTGAGDFYFYPAGNDSIFSGKVIADEVIDLTPAYDKSTSEALTEVLNVKSIGGEIDHSTLPELAQSKIDYEVRFNCEVLCMDCKVDNCSGIDYHIPYEERFDNITLVVENDTIISGMMCEELCDVRTEYKEGRSLSGMMTVQTEAIKALNDKIILLETRIENLELVLNITDDTKADEKQLYSCSYKESRECLGGLSNPVPHTRCYNFLKLGWSTCSSGWVKI